MSTDVWRHQTICALPLFLKSILAIFLTPVSNPTLDPLVGDKVRGGRFPLWFLSVVIHCGASIPENNR